MADSWFSCKPCSGSDPTQDTVKVDPNMLDKENVRPLQYSKENAKEERRREAEEEALSRHKEEAAAAAVAEAARLREEVEQREAAERARQEAEELARRMTERLKAQREAEERKQEEEAIAANAAKAAEAAAKQAAEEERKQREAAKVAEQQARSARKEATKKANAWCKKNGYTDMNTQKKTFKGATKFPLHTAVKYNDQEMIHALLLAGARKDVKDSKSQTPSELAQRMNKDGSHDQIVAMLR